MTGNDQLATFHQWLSAFCLGIHIDRMLQMGPHEHLTCSISPTI